MKEKTKNILNQEFGYHATTVQEMKSLFEKGIQADYNKESVLDFGYGFYLTLDKDSKKLG